MRLISLLTLCALVCAALARDISYLRNMGRADGLHRRAPSHNSARESPPSYANDTSPIIPQTPQTAPFKVDGTAIPDVDFDIGESYAGLLPISNEPNISELFFWFFPTSNVQASDEILIWLNGGPGCSSLEGLLQENGPFLWQYGTYSPLANNYAWSNLTNVVWVEQPAGTGFSQMNGSPPAKDEIELAAQFLGFWKNFVDTFALHGRKVYITGESYAGYYVPYIADAMHNETDTEYYNIESIMIYDPLTTYDVISIDIPAVPMVNNLKPLFNLNETFMQELNNLHESCGFAEFLETAMTFPPTGPLPLPPNVDRANESCHVGAMIEYAAQLVNPCWDIYQIATTCPLLWDVMGFPGSFSYLPQGATVYFNRTDVQKAINAPIQNWEECANVFRSDTSPPSGLSILPRVIEKNTKTVIGHGTLDFIILLEGTIMMIQNMTWNGAQGFSVPPSEWNDFYVPYHSELNQGSMAGAGNFGKWHTERGLTFSTVELAGHMIPQYAPSAAYRQLEFLLGRIESLGEVSDFTTQKGMGDFGNGNATMRMRMMGYLGSEDSSGK